MIEAAKWFNMSTGTIKYLWPKYFPGKARVSGFFEDFKKSLSKRMASEAVFESIDGKLVASSLLMAWPVKFCDQKGQPLTATTKSASRYLSQRYSVDDHENLAVFGVQEVADKDFVQELSIFMKDDPASFCNRTSEWHSNLARALAPICSDSQLFPRIERLKLIPLRDKRWVSLKEDKIFFPGDHGLTVPDGINMLVVDEDAAAEPFQRHLCLLLGVQDFSVVRLCQYIVSVHNDPKFNPRTVSNSALLSQALFLFNAGYVLDKSEKFWCVQECGTRRCCASTLYLPSEEPLSTSILLGGEKNKYHFLHSTYVDAVPNNQDRWYNWLVGSLRIAIYPRLVLATGKDGFRVSDDFDWLLLTKPSADILLLLRDQWQIYAPFVEDDGKTKEGFRSRRNIRERLSLLSVKCRDGITRQARNTYIPNNQLVSAAKGCVAFVDVPNPEDRRWETVSYALGIGLKDDLEFYLQALQTLKLRNPTKDVVTNFLEQIQARSASEFSKIK
jgi:hypothetical protein